MLTPQDILDKKFDKVMVWGYDMNAVDSFLEEVEGDYAQLYKENITLKSKMKVLVAKIEEYRSVDEAMRQALLNAQTMAAELVEKARAECESMQRNAVGDLAERESGYRERIAMQEMQLEEAKGSCQAFIDRMTAAYEQELSSLRTLRESEVPQPIARPASTVQAPAAAQAAVQIPAVSEVPAETIPLPAAQMTPPTRHAVRPQADSAAMYEDEDDDTHDMRVFEVDTAHSGHNASARPKPRPRRAPEDDEEELVLSQRPRFDFKNLQFGDKYGAQNTQGKNKKRG